jgi:hypothetical protein
MPGAVDTSGELGVGAGATSEPVDVKRDTISPALLEVAVDEPARDVELTGDVDG